MLEVLEKASSDALEAALRKKRCFVSPEHRFRQLWDLIQVTASVPLDRLARCAR